MVGIIFTKLTLRIIYQLVHVSFLAWGNCITVNNMLSESTKRTAFATIWVLCWTSIMASKSTHAHLSLHVASAIYGMPGCWCLDASTQVLPPSTEISTLSIPRPPPDAAYPLTFTCTTHIYEGLKPTSPLLVKHSSHHIRHCGSKSIVSNMIKKEVCNA